MAQPAWSDLTPTPAGARHAKSATPTKPSARPSQRSRLMRSPSHSQATSAPNSGTVAFRIDVSPVAMCMTAQENKANGMAELTTPASKMGRQCWRSAGHCPWRSSTGHSSAVASATRRPAVAMGPNSAAPMRMKRKEAPHKEARKTNSPNHEDMGAWEVTVTRGAFCAVEGQRGG